MNFFFTADEHYGHEKSIYHNQRPFKSVEEMEKVLIKNHNSIVKKDDITIHAGDFVWKHSDEKQIIKKLNGNHIVLCGSHGFSKGQKQIWEKTIEGQKVVVCHYAMRTWAASHYNSWQLHGHSHGGLEPIGKQIDVGVDTHNFFPWSWEEICKTMDTRSDNFNLVERK